MNSIKKSEYDQILDKAGSIQKKWREILLQKRGISASLCNQLRESQEDIAHCIMTDAKKIGAEALGEVQEAIDMCDFALGLSRQLYGLTIASERPEHKLQEAYHPLGVIGVITAFNFPCAVWAWNHCLSMVCGNSVVWKGSPKALNVTAACKKAWDQAVQNCMPERDRRSVAADRRHEGAGMVADDLGSVAQRDRFHRNGKALPATRKDLGRFSNSVEQRMIVSLHGNWILRFGIVFGGWDCWSTLVQPGAAHCTGAGL